MIAPRKRLRKSCVYNRDGRQLFDRLLKPLNVSAKHLIIVPDKSLWTIPFQALSADGEKYLIEDRLISYAPSISVLLEQLKAPRPARRTLQALANSSYENRLLRHVNAEAAQAAGIYHLKPLLNLTAQSFYLLTGEILT